MMNLISRIKNDPQYKNTNHVINTSICLGCLGLTQVLKGVIVAAFPDSLWIFFLFQFFGSSFQGGLSDVYKRSLILNIALLFVLFFVSLLIVSHYTLNIFYPYLHLLCMIFLGLGGNADVVGRAGIIDIHFHKNRRRIMSWTVAAEAFSWVIVGALMRAFNVSPLSILYAGIGLAFLLLVGSLLFNTDSTEDKKHLHNPFHEAILLFRDKKESIKKVIIILVVIFGELGFFFYFYNQETNIKNMNLLSDTYLSWFIGMTLGCLALSKIKKYSDLLMLNLGLILSIIPAIFYVAFAMKGVWYPGMFYPDNIFYFIGGIGSGFYLPCFYSMISHGHNIHFQGILTGSIDSLRVLGDAITMIVLYSVSFPNKYAPIIISALLYLVTIVLTVACRQRIFQKDQ